MHYVLAINSEEATQKLWLKSSYTISPAAAGYLIQITCIPNINSECMLSSQMMHSQ